MKSKPDIDCLFVHVPKFSAEYAPLGEFLNITYMPMGLLALAELVRRSGRRCRVLHLGIEWMRDKNFSIADELRETRVRAVGLPLYWHYQAYDTIRVAGSIKDASPDTFVFLGGVTASYFAEEILREFPFVDAIILGHGEGPLPVLLEELENDAPDLGKVPSLVFRHEGEIRRSRSQYFATKADLDDLVFAELPLLRGFESYVEHFGFPLAFSKEYRKEEHQRHGTMGRTFFPLCTGRGCPVSCTYCGGNRDTLRRINGRNRILWRGHGPVLEDIRRALDAGYRTVSLCFDPYPEKDDYYVELFERIRKEKLKVDFYFECWGLPTERFLRAFADTFQAPHSYLAYSPDTGSEKVRRMNKGYYYSNNELRQAIRRAEELGIPLDIFFSIALPGEKLKEARETRELIAEIGGKYANIQRLMTWSVQLEPGSPQYERPADFNMITDRHSFLDFYQAHGGEKADTYSSLGFKINGYFGDERDRGGIPEFEAAIQHLKCMEFCFLSPDPRRIVTPDQGRAHCLERRQVIARRRGVTQPQRIIDDDHRYEDATRALRAGLPKTPRPELVIQVQDMGNTSGSGHG